MKQVCDGCNQKIVAGESVPVFCWPCTTKQHITPQRRFYIILITSGQMAGHVGWNNLRDIIWSVAAGKMTEHKIKVKLRKKEEE